MTKEQMIDSLSKVMDVANSGELSFNSAILFFRIVTRTDFEYEEGMGGYAWEKDLRLTSEERGNLTDLKKKGLLSMQLEYDSHRAQSPAHALKRMRGYTLPTRAATALKSATSRD